jgi:hypothetical protein
LEQIENRPNELTFDSIGRVIIDNVAIPGSNMFVLLPMLFKTKKSKNLPGLSELIEKLDEMGLTHFITANVLKGKGKDLKTFEPTFSNKQPWYYLGP